LKRRAKEIIKKVREDERIALLEPEAKALVSLYGINVPSFYVAKSEVEVVRAANTIGYPLALKIVSPHILHKTDVGGVKLHISDERALLKAYREILSNVREKAPHAEIVGVHVEEMAPPTVEVIIGALTDAQFGPVVMFGLGGIFVELIRDVSFRLAPISKEEALQMMKEVKGYRLLTGFRSTPPLDVDSVADAISKVSVMVAELEEISQVDLNPVMVYQKGIIAVDARVILREGATD